MYLKYFLNDLDTVLLGGWREKYVGSTYPFYLIWENKKHLHTVHNTLYVFIPHFFTLSNFSTATPRETSSVELLVLWFDDPIRGIQEKNECTH